MPPRGSPTSSNAPSKTRLLPDHKYFLKLTPADQLDAHVEVNRAMGPTWNLEVRNSIFELKLEFMAS